MAYSFIYSRILTPPRSFLKTSLGDDYNDNTDNYTYQYDTKIGLFFHFYFQCNFIFYFNLSDIVYLNTIKQLFCVNIEQEKMLFSCDNDINYLSCQKSPLRIECNLNALNTSAD